MAGALIETRGLSKAYLAIPAVVDFTWSVEPGSIAALVGPNGAGKTTLLKMLLGMTRPTAGSATILGRDVVSHSVEIRRQVAMVPEDKLLYDDMRVSHFLRFFGSFFPAWDQVMAEQLLAAWDVPFNRTIKELSKGMRAKLALGAALSRHPRVLLLDEPTIDLDPAGVEQVLSWISGWVAEEDRCAVVATHRLEEVERICDQISFLHGGRAIFFGDLDDLKSDWRSLTAYGRVPVEEVEGWEGVRQVCQRGDVAGIIVERDAVEVQRRLVGLGLGTVEIHPMSLREIYLAVTEFRRTIPNDALEGVD